MNDEDTDDVSLTLSFADDKTPDTSALESIKSQSKHVEKLTKESSQGNDTSDDEDEAGECNSPNGNMLHISDTEISSQFPSVESDRIKTDLFVQVQPNVSGLSECEAKLRKMNEMLLNTIMQTGRDTEKLVSNGAVLIDLENGDEEEEVVHSGDEGGGTKNNLNYSVLENGSTIQTCTKIGAEATESADGFQEEEDAIITVDERLYRVDDNEHLPETHQELCESDEDNEDAIHPQTDNTSGIQDNDQSGIPEDSQHEKSCDISELCSPGGIGFSRMQNTEEEEREDETDIGQSKMALNLEHRFVNTMNPPEENEDVEQALWRKESDSNTSEALNSPDLADSSDEDAVKDMDNGEIEMNLPNVSDELLSSSEDPPPEGGKENHLEGDLSHGTTGSDDEDLPTVHLVDEISSFPQLRGESVGDDMPQVHVVEGNTSSRETLVDELAVLPATNPGAIVAIVTQHIDVQGEDIANIRNEVQLEISDRCENSSFSSDNRIIAKVSIRTRSPACAEGTCAFGESTSDEFSTQGPTRGVRVANTMYLTSIVVHRTIGPEKRHLPNAHANQPTSPCRIKSPRGASSTSNQNPIPHLAGTPNSVLGSVSGIRSAPNTPPRIEGIASHSLSTSEIEGNVSQETGSNGDSSIDTSALIGPEGLIVKKKSHGYVALLGGQGHGITVARGEDTNPEDEIIDTGVRGPRVYTEGVQKLKKQEKWRQDTRRQVEECERQYAECTFRPAITEYAKANKGFQLEALQVGGVYEEKSKSTLQRLKTEVEKRVMSECTFKPRLSTRSEELAKQKHLGETTAERLLRKKKYPTDNKFSSTEEEIQCTFTPNISVYAKQVLTGDERQVARSKSESRKKKIQEEIQQHERELYTFKPVINHVSLQLASKKKVSEEEKALKHSEGIAASLDKISEKFGGSKESKGNQREVPKSPERSSPGEDEMAIELPASSEVIADHTSAACKTTSSESEEGSPAVNNVPEETPTPSHVASVGLTTPTKASTPAPHSAAKSDGRNTSDSPSGTIFDRLFQDGCAWKERKDLLVEAVKKIECSQRSPRTGSNRVFADSSNRISSESPQKKSPVDKSSGMCCILSQPPLNVEPPSNAEEKENLKRKANQRHGGGKSDEKPRTRDPTPGGRKTPNAPPTSSSSSRTNSGSRRASSGTRAPVNDAVPQRTMEDIFKDHANYLARREKLKKTLEGIEMTECTFRPTLNNRKQRSSNVPLLATNSSPLAPASLESSKVERRKPKHTSSRGLSTTARTSSASKVNREDFTTLGSHINEIQNIRARSTSSHLNGTLCVSSRPVDRQRTVPSAEAEKSLHTPPKPCCHSPLTPSPHANEKAPTPVQYSTSHAPAPGSSEKALRIVDDVGIATDNKLAINADMCNVEDTIQKLSNFISSLPRGGSKQGTPKLRVQADNQQVKMEKSPARRISDIIRQGAKKEGETTDSLNQVRKWLEKIHTCGITDTSPIAIPPAATPTQDNHTRSSSAPKNMKSYKTKTLVQQGAKRKLFETACASWQE